MTTDLGKGSARTNDAVPRQRGGAHAATKTSRFRRKSRPASAPRSVADPAPAVPLTASLLPPQAAAPRSADITPSPAVAPRSAVAPRVTAAGHWVLVTAAITGAVALALACAPGRRRGRRPGGRADGAPGGTPIPAAGGTLHHG